MNNVWIGFAVFLVLVFASRILNERALRTLNDEESARLLRGFSAFRIYSLAATFAVLGGYFLILRYYPLSTTDAYASLLAGFVVLMLLKTVFIFRKLKKLEMPETYISRFLVVTLVQYGGFFFLFGFLITNR